MGGSGISLAICKSAPRSRQIAMPTPHNSVFYRPNALPVAQPTVSILLKMTFFGFAKVKWLHLTGEVDKAVRFSCKIFTGFNVQKSLKSVNFWQSYSTNEKVDFFGGGTQGTYASVLVPQPNVLITVWSMQLPAITHANLERHLSNRHHLSVERWMEVGSAGQFQREKR